MTRDFQPLDFEPTADGPAVSKRIYDELSGEVRGSKHGNRFDIRDFTLEPQNGDPSPLNVDLPYAQPIPTTDEERGEIAELAGSLIMPEDDWGALVEGFTEVYKRDDVSAHLASGGIVKFIDSHRTYTGQVAQQIGSWVSLRSMDVVDPHEIQHTIISRVTTLFRLQLIVDLFEDEKFQITHHDGAIVEDILLRYGGGLMTLPNSPSGNRLIQMLQDGVTTRRGIVERTKIAYEHIVNRGGSDGQIIFEGSSGAENYLKDIKGVTHRMIGEVKHRTAELTTNYNQVEGAERVMAIPVFMESDPYTNDPENPIEPKPTAFAFLEPRFPKSQREFDLMMAEMAAVGTVIKASGEAPYRYAKTIIGRDLNPRVVFTNRPVAAKALGE
ncbi:hypothetical protein KC992_02205 [Candidatus Saccharibacteria bacterium]|nr:hypothetical protein [Candidatus Saccharibacteria bacterium]